jgi:DNA-directed RNA polymerase specialized sigma24 family protein
MKRRGKKPEHSPFDRLIAEVRVTNMLLAASLREHLGQSEIIRILSTQTNLSAKEIGNVLGTSGATVAVTMSRWRKRVALQEIKSEPSEQEPQIDAEETAETTLRED